jgi:hypothetical protein
VVAIGAGAARDLGNVVGATLVGCEAGGSMTKAAYDTCIGFGAGSAMLSGARNVFLGAHAGYYAREMSDNVCVGASAGRNARYGQNNVLIGARAAETATEMSNVVVIGAGASAAATLSNSVTIGTGVAPTANGTNNVLLGSALDAGNVNQSVVVGTSSTVQGDNVVAVGSFLAIPRTSNTVVMGHSVTFEGDANNIVAFGHNFNLSEADSGALVVGHDERRVIFANADTIILGDKASGQEYFEADENSIRLGGTNQFFVADSGQLALSFGGHVYFFANPETLVLGSPESPYLEATADSIRLGGSNEFFVANTDQLSLRSTTNRFVFANPETMVLGSPESPYLEATGSSIRLGGSNEFFVANTDQLSLGIGADRYIFANPETMILGKPDSPYLEATGSSMRLGGTNEFFLANTDELSLKNVLYANSDTLAIGSDAEQLIFIDPSKISIGSRNLYVGKDDAIDRNTFMGANAAYLLQGTQNTVMGAGAGTHANGNYNASVGVSAGARSAGDQNVAVGTFSLELNEGDNNVAIGRHTGSRDPTTWAGDAHPPGSSNRNIFIGFYAGFHQANCTNTTCLGYRSGDSAQNCTDVTMIGPSTGIGARRCIDTVMIGSSVNARNTALSAFTSDSFLGGVRIDVHDSRGSVVCGRDIQFLGENAPIEDSVVLGSNIASTAIVSNSVLIGKDMRSTESVRNSILIGSARTPVENVISISTQFVQALNADIDTTRLCGKKIDIREKFFDDGSADVQVWGNLVVFNDANGPPESTVKIHGALNSNRIVVGGDFPLVHIDASDFRLYVTEDNAAKPVSDTWWTTGYDASGLVSPAGVGGPTDIRDADLTGCATRVRALKLDEFTVNGSTRLGWTTANAASVIAHTVRSTVEYGDVLNADQIYKNMFGALQHAFTSIDALTARVKALDPMVFHVPFDGSFRDVSGQGELFDNGYGTDVPYVIKPSNVGASQTFDPTTSSLTYTTGLAPGTKCANFTRNTQGDGTTYIGYVLAQPLMRPFSMTFWARLVSSANGVMAFLSRDYGVWEDADHMTVELQYATQFDMNLVGTVGGASYSSTQGTIARNTWYHFAIVLTGTTIKFYYAPQTAGPYAPTTFEIQNSSIQSVKFVGFANFFVTNTNSFKGLMQGVQVHSKELTQSNIESIFRELSPAA